MIYLKDKKVELRLIPIFRSSLLTVPFLSLPFLSAIGAVWVSIQGSNIFLMLLIAIISILFIAGVASERLLPLKLYPFALLMISLAVLLHSSLVSAYIVPFGSDVPIEYFVFQTTQNSLHWSSSLPLFSDQTYGRVNAMLSVTILPTFYSTALNIESTWVFRLLFPLIFCFIPLALYQIWKAYVGEKNAFISAFLLIAQSTFYTEMLSLNRQMIGELFFVLLLLVIFDKKMKSANRIICYSVFSFALIASHYAIAEIFLFLIVFAFISLFLLKRPNRSITVGMLVLFSAMAFGWYVYTARSAAFESFVGFGNYVYNQLGDFFDPASRGSSVLRGLGLEESPSVWNTISRGVAYLTQIFIVVGFLGLLLKKIKIRFEREYFIFSSVAMTLLAALIVVPGLANTMNMTRFYHILLFFLAPFCVIGAEYAWNLVLRHKRNTAAFFLVLFVLVPYFLFQTGFVYEITGTESWSVPLSMHRMNALRLFGSRGYIDSYDVHGAQWLSKNADSKHIAVYADEISQRYVLTIYGVMYQGYVNGLSNTTTVATDGLVYLSTLNIVYETIGYRPSSWNLTEMSSVFDGLTPIYSNGKSEVCCNPK
jgi:uncharacterized membrane protein